MGDLLITFKKPQVNEKAVRRRTNAIRLSNNVITDWSGFMEICEALIEQPRDLEWIDLSFNDIIRIDKVTSCNVFQVYQVL